MELVGANVGVNENRTVLVSLPPDESGISGGDCVCSAVSVIGSEGSKPRRQSDSDVDPCIEAQAVQDVRVVGRRQRNTTFGITRHTRLPSTPRRCQRVNVSNLRSIPDTPRKTRRIDPKPPSIVRQVPGIRRFVKCVSVLDNEEPRRFQRWEQEI